MTTSEQKRQRITTQNRQRDSRSLLDDKQRDKQRRQQQQQQEQQQRQQARQGNSNNSEGNGGRIGNGEIQGSFAALRMTT
jgi:hypothetical protein